MSFKETNQQRKQRKYSPFVIPQVLSLFYIEVLTNLTKEGLTNISSCIFKWLFSYNKYTFFMSN